tara:strand:- start:942 stop:2633 length:1692 start_codon:yes stop_codon:yes gene_type:complete
MHIDFFTRTMDLLRGLLGEGPLAGEGSHYFEQRLDHVGQSADGRTFQQQYYVRDQYFARADAPIFVYLGGEAPLYGPPRRGSFVDVLAKRSGALLFALEHRFYGESIPFAELTTANLRYLSTEQAVHDVARFCEGIQPVVAEVRRSRGLGSGSESLPGELGPALREARASAYIVLGGSYAGAIAAWTRLAFPKVVRGAVASSAVVEAATDFSQFDEQIARSAGGACASAMRGASRGLDRLLAARAEGGGALARRLFGTAEAEADATAALTDGDLRFLLADALAMPVMFGVSRHVCDRLLAPEASALDAAEAAARGEPIAALLVSESAPQLYAPLVAAANYTRRLFYPTLEFGPEEYATPFLADTRTVAARSGRQWWWQKCSELGLFQTAAARMPVRSVHLDLRYFRDTCRALFGDDELWPDTNALNRQRGGHRFAGSNVFFTNGADDPWLHASVSGTLSGTGSAAHVIRCAGCGHCVDLRAPSADDAPELLRAREAVHETLSQWLQAPTASLEDSGADNALSPDRWLDATPMGDPDLLAAMTSMAQQSGMLEAQPQTPVLQTG